jgi:micrococcal nuclease
MRRFATSVFVVVALLVGSASAASLPLTVVSLTSPVAPFTDATLHARTAPGADCEITVIYKSGPSQAKGLFAKQADLSGDVAWQWRVGSNTTPGRWPILVACSKGHDAAELETAFEVRR